MTGAIWKSAFVAALFALHPLHVESIAWIAERKDVLSAFFWMLTLCLYVYYTEKPVIQRYLLVLFGFVCALMSKPMVVTLPVIMILLDYWPLGRLQSRKTGTNLTDVMPVSTNKGKKKTKSRKETLKENISPYNDKKLSETKIAGIIPLWQLREKIPFFVLSAVFSVITLLVYNEPDRIIFPFSARIANAPVSFVTYLEKTFWPHDLAVFYPFSDQLPLWQVFGATLLIFVISSAVIVMLRRLPYLFVGWLWYAITIAPVIGIIPSGAHAMADRYHYLPSVGITIMLAWGIPSLIKSEDIRKKILFPAGIGALAILSVLTWQQCGYWKNSATLFSHALQVTKDNALAHNNLGLALFNEGKIKEAIDHYNHAIRIIPDYNIAYNNRGSAYDELGQYQLAIEDCNQAIHLNPDYAEAYNNRGLAYANLGQYKLAIEDYGEAIRLKPDYADAYYNWGLAYYNLGQYQLAIEDYNEAIRLKPDYAKAYNNRGIVYFLQGNNELGCHDAQKVCKLGDCKLLELTKSKGDCH
jgi:tetratricopeptide (TPR) repeat protein